jgi:hypothetical protein
MGWWDSLFTGNNPTLSANIQKTGAIGDWATGQGEKNVGTASNFWNSILSGDSSKISQSLAPEISSAKTSANQDMKTTAMFGGRSGGTAASNAATKDSIHGYITNLIGSLTGNAASSLASTGGGLLSTGLSAYGQQEQADAARMQNWSDSILGLGVTHAVGAGISAGLKALTGGAA